MLIVKPITLRAANAWVAEHHRHHTPARGCVFCVSVWGPDGLCGVAIAGRPKARMLDNGAALEVTRCCTDGTRNACSKLYATVAKVARQLGYERILTYTLPSEGGASLRAAGWVCTSENAGGGSWARDGRERPNEQHPLDGKWRWEAVA